MSLPWQIEDEENEERTVTSDRVTSFKLEFVHWNRLKQIGGTRNGVSLYDEISRKNVRLEGYGRAEVGKGRTRTDDVWNKKKKGKNGRS